MLGKWLRPDRERSAEPVTVIGQFLLAALLGDTNREKYLLNQIDGPAGGPESAFWQGHGKVVT